MGAALAKCSFCDDGATFGPYESVSVCEPCGRRIARVAERGEMDALGSIWASTRAPAAGEKKRERVGGEQHAPDDAVAEFRRGVDDVVSAENVEAHLDLARVYCEMGLYADAVREAAVALPAAREKRRSTPL